MLGSRTHGLVPSFGPHPFHRVTIPSVEFGSNPAQVSVPTERQKQGHAGEQQGEPWLFLVGSAQVWQRSASTSGSVVSRWPALLLLIIRRGVEAGIRW